MSDCTDCKIRPAGSYGSQRYRRTDLCIGCYYAAHSKRCADEDTAKRIAMAFQAPPAAPSDRDLPTPAQPPGGGDSPVWEHGKNVAVREKLCDRCGLLIHIRKKKNGDFYPAIHGTTAPHWHQCAETRAAGPAAVSP